MYQHFKPFRNRLRGTNALAALEAIFRLSQFLSFQQPLPPELRHPHLALGMHPMKVGLFPWDMEQLAREIILNAPLQAGTGVNWSTIANLVNQMREVNGAAYRLLPPGVTVLHELHRIAHHQFPFQRLTWQGDISRYFMIYDHPSLAPLLADAFGMTATEFFQIALALLGHYLDDPYLNVPAANELNQLAPEVLERFLRGNSQPFPRMRELARNAISYDANWTYSFNPLREFPLIALDHPLRLMCPIPMLLVWRVTDGVFFDLVRRDGFAQGLGRSFEDYVGEVLARSNTAGAYRVLPEQRYGSSRRPRDSADWIADSPSGTLFIECKARRHSLQAKIDVTDLNAVRAAADQMASFVVQLYCTLSDALAGCYPHWQADGRPVFPIVVTLSDWFIHGRLADDVDRCVRESLVGKGIDPELVDRHPYTICAAQDLESLAQVGAVVGLGEVMSSKTAPGHRAWHLGAFLTERFGDVQQRHTEDLFPEMWRLLEP